jgi:ribonuclease BN (tRNA processing enzyme)
MKPVSVLFLGTGDAFSAGGRSQSGTLVQSDGAIVLLDCGATALVAMKRAGIRPDLIDAILISHLHGDHFAGIPFLFLHATYLETRSKPLCIAGPPGIAERVQSLFRALYPDSAANPLPFELEYREMMPGQNLVIGDCAVDPFRVPHQDSEISLGLRISLAGKRILYSGDTGWTDDLVRWSEGTDLFICECSFFETRLPSHLDYRRIAQNRNRFGTRHLVLTHLGQEVLDHRREIDIELAHDGMVVELP